MELHKYNRYKKKWYWTKEIIKNEEKYNIPTKTNNKKIL